MFAFGQKELSVYFEHQEADDNLCGLHCLNALLQAPIYDEVSQILKFSDIILACSGPFSSKIRILTSLDHTF